ncbi:hypothetical protein WME79_12415 [Sorangium sp. So ce726]|uniref:hypothetical protein n=1 Tax=Sorangium sp. So ce726 TaxID=3133319 RepID=UPI003F5F1778
MRAVSVFAGAFDLDGAAAVSAARSVAVLDALASLSAKSLLAVEPEGDGVTCRLLETTRAYSVGRLRDSGEEQAVRRRHAEHVCAVLDKAKAEWARRSAREWGAAYGPLVDDLRSALAWAGSDAAHRSLLIELTVAGTLLWNHLSLTVECRAHVSRALEELEHQGLVGTPSEMQLRMSLAAATLFTRGPIPDVLVALQRTLELAERCGDVDHRLRSLRTIGSYNSFSGQYATAIATYERFASVASEHDPSALPDGETHHGIAEIFVGRLQSARRRLERLEQQSLLGFDDSRLARFLYDRNVDIGNVLSYAQWLTGSPDTAAQTAEATVRQALKVKHGLSLSNALAVAACPTFFMSRRYEECGRYLAMLDDQVRQQGIVIWSRTARFYRGALACAQGEPSRGVEDLERAVVEFRAISQLDRIAWQLAVLADALARSGRLADAVTTIQEAVDSGRTRDERWCMPEVLRIQASILTATGRPDEAEPVLLEALAVARDIGGLSWLLRAAIDLARLWQLRSRSAEAHALLLPIYTEFTEGFATGDLVDAAELIAATAPSRN